MGLACVYERDWALTYQTSKMVRATCLLPTTHTPDTGTQCTGIWRDHNQESLRGKRTTLVDTF